MRKIIVIGSGGAGKSTFSRRLSELLNMKVIHLDSLYWHPGWVETPKPVWRRMMEEMVKQDSWIIDGNYSGTLDVRVKACDTIIFLDLSRTLCVWRVLKRVALYRSELRPDMAEGCAERFSWQFVRWVWQYPTRTRPRVLKLLAEHAQGKTIFRLRTRGEMEKFLANLRPTPEKSFEPAVQ